MAMRAHRESLSHRVDRAGPKFASDSLASLCFFFRNGLVLRPLGIRSSLPSTPRSMDEDDLSIYEEALGYPSPSQQVAVPNKKRKEAEPAPVDTSKSGERSEGTGSKKVKREQDSSTEIDDVVLYDREEAKADVPEKRSAGDADLVLAISDVDLLQLRASPAAREGYMAYYRRHAADSGSNMAALFRYAGIKKADEYADVIESMLTWIVALQAAAGNIAPFNLLLQTVATADVIRAACVASYGVKCMKWLSIMHQARAQIFPVFQLHSNIIDRQYWRELLGHELSPCEYLEVMIAEARNDTRERLAAEGSLTEGDGGNDEESAIRKSERASRLKDAFKTHHQMMEAIGMQLNATADGTPRTKGRRNMLAAARPVALYVTALREAVARVIDTPSTTAANDELDDAELAMDLADEQTSPGVNAKLADMAPSVLHWFICKTISVCWRLLHVTLDRSETDRTCAVTGRHLAPGESCYLIVLTMNGIRRHYYHIAPAAPSIAPGEGNAQTPRGIKVPNSVFETWPLMKHLREINRKANADIDMYESMKAAKANRSRPANAPVRRGGIEDEYDIGDGGIDLSDYESQDEEELARARATDEKRRQKRLLKKTEKKIGAEFVSFEAGRSRRDEDDEEEDEDEDEEEEEEDEDEEDEEDDGYIDEDESVDTKAVAAGLSEFRRGLKGVSAHTRDALRAESSASESEQGDAEEDENDPYRDCTFYYEPGKTISVVDTARTGSGGTESHTRLPTNKTIIAHSVLTQAIYVALVNIECCPGDKKVNVTRGRAIYENMTCGATKSAMDRLISALYGPQNTDALAELRALFDALYIDVGFLERPPPKRLPSEEAANWLEARPERLMVHHSYLGFLPRPLVSGEELPPVLDALLAYLATALVEVPARYLEAYEVYCAEDATVPRILNRLVETGANRMLACIYQLTAPIRVPAFAHDDQDTTRA